ncbi:carbonyl reductase [NADPH] 1 [Polymixia lowei]
MSSQQVAVVTGSNKGIGLAIVRALCQQFKGVVYLTARDSERGRDALETLAAEGLKPLFRQLDINDLDTICGAAIYFKQKYGGVDILINNAGIAFKVADDTPFAVQADVTLHTNFFCTRDMLTHFLPIIKPGGRVVNVSSFVGTRTLNLCSPALQERFRSSDLSEHELVHLMKQFVKDVKKDRHKQRGWPETAYGVSKLGVTALSMVMARLLSKERPGDKILLNACCPGWVRTDMAGHEATKSPDEGAETPVYLALLPPGTTEPHGQIVSDKKVQPW